MSRTPTLIALALVGLTSAPALAGGPVQTEADPAAATTPAWDWSGYHLDLRLGSPLGKGYQELPFYLGGIVSEGEAWNGTVATLSLGRDWQRGTLVYGAALSLTSGDIGAMGFYASWPNGSFQCMQCETTIDRQVALTGRIGLARGRTLYYATAGLVRADVVATALSGTVPMAEATRTGHQVGIGVEYRLRPGLSVLAEYTRTDLGRFLVMEDINALYATAEFETIQLGVSFRW